MSRVGETVCMHNINPMACQLCLEAEIGALPGENISEYDPYDDIKSLRESIADLREELESLLFATQCLIINRNGKVPALTDQQVFDGAIEARENAKKALKRLKARGHYVEIK